MLKQYRILGDAWYGKNLLSEQDCDEVITVEQPTVPDEGITAEFIFRFYDDSNLWSFEGYSDSIEFIFGPAKDIFDTIKGMKHISSAEMIQILNKLGYVDKTERIRAY